MERIKNPRNGRHLVLLALTDMPAIFKVRRTESSSVIMAIQILENQFEVMCLRCIQIKMDQKWKKMVPILYLVELHF